MTQLIAVAPFGDRLHVAVCVERDGERLILSARKANSREVALHESETRPPERR